MEYLLFITDIVIARARAFNGPFSGTTRVGRHQKGETNLDDIVIAS